MVEQWFALQSSSPGMTAARVRELMQHPAFDLRNPNKVRTLVLSFAQNVQAFHDPQGEGYRLLADIIAELNTLNPQVAARMMNVLADWKRFAEPVRGRLEQALRLILATPNLSQDVFEMAERALQG
jgi:aminopeptidase N